MIRSLHQNVRRVAGLGAVAMLALPVSAQAADYHGQLSESISNGAPGASPMLSLHATLDNGNGGAPVSTGSLRFVLDARHLAPTAWASLMAASPGAQIGSLTSEISGATASPLRVVAHGTDANGAFVRAGVAVPSDTAALIGNDSLPLILRQTAPGKQISLTLNTQEAVGKLTAKGATFTLENVTLAIRGAVTFGGKSHALTMNPVKEATVTNSITAQACAQPACTTLRPTTSTSDASVHLPKTVTIAAPDTALYGYRYSIQGTARPGDQVTLQALSNDALMPVRGAATVRPDGSFLIRTTLRSAFSDNGNLALPARGRYAVASTEGGNATVYGIANQDTRVRLAQPRFVLQHKAGGKLHFAVRVPGADQHVRIAIMLGTKTLAKGYANHGGRFFKTIIKPATIGNLRVVAAVPGADTAISTATPLSR